MGSNGMWLAAIYRYPVKSMAGEALQEVALERGGIPGDRSVFVVGPTGRILTARKRPELLTHRALLGPSGEPLVDGLPWRSAEVAAAVERAAGEGARLEAADGGHLHDILPLLVATDGAVAAFGYDVRRLRPNLVIGGVEGLAERQWEGRQLACGEAIIGIEDLRDRCVMITVDPGTNERRPEILREVVQRFDGKLALNCAVAKPGFVRVGDPVRLLE